MIQHASRQLATEDEFEEAFVELVFGDPRMTASHAFAAHRPRKPREIVHEGQASRGCQPAQGGDLHTQCIARRVPCDSSVCSPVAHSRTSVVIGSMTAQSSPERAVVARYFARRGGTIP